MKRFLSIEELREKAQSSVPKMFFDYCESGSWDEESPTKIFRFKKIQFKPRVVRDLLIGKQKLLFWEKVWYANWFIALWTDRNATCRW